MSYVPPSYPHGFRTVTDPSKPLGWTFKRVYPQKQRSTLDKLWIRLRWQVRRWRWEYGW